MRRRYPFCQEVSDERADQALYKSKSLGRNRLITVLGINGEGSADGDPVNADAENRCSAVESAKISSYESFKASFNSDL